MNNPELESTEHETTDLISNKLAKVADRLSNNTIDLAIRSKEAREFLEWHVNRVRESWMAWNDESSKVLESIRQTRVAIGFESKQLLSECGDVRKFFLADDHKLELDRLREFIELVERLRSLKNDGTLDRVADIVLKLA